MGIAVIILGVLLFFSAFALVISVCAGCSETTRANEMTAKYKAVKAQRDQLLVIVGASHGESEANDDV